MNIIAVDDEQGALNLLQDSITTAVPNAQVYCFSDPGEALEMMKEEPCEVAFLDIQMRRMNGIILARQMKEIYPKINIVFVTGYFEYAGEAFALYASGYVYKPVTPEKILAEMENLRHPVRWKETGIFARTFGTFALFVNGEEVSFGREKSKEMLAYLIDREGKHVTRKELAGILFEKSEYNRATQDYMSKIIRELVHVLEQAGAGQILKRRLNSYAVDTDTFDCDYYDYEKENATPEQLNCFQGEYMKQYSWAEVTLARLHWEKQDGSR